MPSHNQRLTRSRTPEKYKTIAVVGLSSNPMRPSYGVTEYMQGADIGSFP